MSPSILYAPPSSDAVAASAPHLRLHRARVAAAFCAGRSVFESEAMAGESAAASPHMALHSAGCVLRLAGEPAQTLLEALPDLVVVMEANGLLVLAEAADTPSPRLIAALEQRFSHVVTLQQKIVTGSVLAHGRQAASRILPLTAPLQADTVCLLHLCSNTPLSVPPPDFLEGGEADWEAHASAPSIPPVIEALQLPQEAQATKARSQAVALVERLMQLDEQIFAQHLQIARLDQKVQESRPASQAYFDIPRTKQAWPLAENPALAPNDLDFYDRRVDDAAVLEARAGEAFFARFSLFDTIPDFSGAIAALNRLKRSTRPSAKGAPDVSIIIPIYGQLAYTLNCLESLLPHVARASFEIIIVDDASLDQSGPMLAALRGVRLLRQVANAGFIASCNAGAVQVKGRFVLFLNNDTRVVPGWLDALVESFVTLPEAGLVGSKLLYPDGSLQEAGGIIWRDGSAWNNGRNDDPNRPHYSYAREVDYISGCSILLRTELWRQLGGFDPYYAPAYCEDADLALRIRALGLRVWFQPQSQIIHYEGKTSGTDAQQGVKAYQVINARKLFLRWREQLAGHRPNGEAPFLERERRVRKRALIIDATAPTPKQDAGSVTTSLTLKLFQQLGYKAHFVPQDNFLFQREYSTDLQAIGIEVAYAPYELDFESYIRRYGWSFDVVLVYRVTVLDKVLDDLRRHAPQAPVLFHNMDLHYLRMGRQAELSNDPKALAEAEAMKARELGLIARVDCTITHSTYERDLLHAALKLAPVVVWPFMFEFHGTTMGFAERRDFIFLGGYGHAPNVDAVMFFVRDVLPLIKVQEPSARFIIAGARPSPEVLALASSDVIVTGMVDDLRTVFDTARVFACSLRIGAGTKGKVSTAMAYGLPVVSTACGAEGMDLVDGEEVLLADTAADFAAACLRVYRDPALWQLMSEAGMRLVQEKHSLAMGRRVLGEAIEAAWRHKLQLGEISHAASSANTTSTTPSATI